MKLITKLCLLDLHIAVVFVVVVVFSHNKPVPRLEKTGAHKLKRIVEILKWS